MSFNAAREPKLEVTTITQLIVLILFLFQIQEELETTLIPRELEP
jgi:hypothetical protein